MKRFIYKILLFLILLFAFECVVYSFGAYVIGNQYEQGYNASILDKVDRLCSLESPKIILAGNSNLAFGIQSELLEDAFKKPVVNLGLHGGLGNAFLEDMAKYNIQKGDIIVICHTDFDDNDTITDPSLAWITIENHSRLRRLIRWRDIWDMVKTYPVYFRKALFLWVRGTGNRPTDSCYSRGAFNKFGDITYRPEAERLSEQELYKLASKTKPGKVGALSVNRLNKLNKYICERGAWMLVAGYPIAIVDNMEVAPDFEVFQEELERNLDCSVISNFTDYFFDYHLLYNTHLHLTEEGAKIRTEQLISDLSVWMQESGYEIPGENRILGSASA